MSAPDGRLPIAFTTAGSASFVEFLAAAAPDLLPARRPLPDAAPDAPHGTTIVAVTCTDGVVMAGDRRATLGSMIASAHIEKVFPADDHSAIGIAGSAGPGLELVRLFQLELEHYEKIEGTELSLDGKANRLATMLRGHLEWAMRGLAVVPLFAGLDVTTGRGRIFSYDVTGGRYEEHDHHSVGSGSVFARGSLKKTWRPGLGVEDAVRVAVEALVDAAEDDAGTGGPDRTRQVWPVVAVVTAEGYRRVDPAHVGEVVEAVVETRRASHAAREDRPS